MGCKYYDGDAGDASDDGAGDYNGRRKYFSMTRDNPGQPRPVPSRW